ncbi:DUF996 domain-containing protein [Vulcanisaeta thermophila]|uniref:DUF996 domain-containing protein n=1 Tax=Vulcanisaeta thermophila TaxID=867917 RepID=UPI00085306AC|nr:DUF996 domain-containing protein [Vulcanisaeta thermophila]
MALNIEDVRTAGLLGLIGVILVVISIPVVVSPRTWAAPGLIGLAIILIALGKLSRAFNNPGIYRKALYGVLTNIVGGTAIVFIITLAGFKRTTCITNSPIQPQLCYIGPPTPVLAITLVTALWVVFYAVVLITYWFLREAYTGLANASGIGDFNEAAKWYWYGALTFILLVGALLIFVGHVYAASGYYKLRRYARK